MLNLKLRSLFIFILGILGASAPTWAQTELPLNNLRVTNRAQCALDAAKPTESVFLMLDGYNAGKAGHALAKNMGLDSDEFSKESMLEFRLATADLLSEIMNRLFTGALPLLPMNIKDGGTLKTYGAQVKNCGTKVYCSDLNAYLSKIWSLSEKKIAGEAVNWAQADNFTANNFFALKGANRVSCNYVKKFSPLQGHLHTPEINEYAVQEMAQAWIDKDQYITSCRNRDAALDNRNAVIQLDLKIGSDEEWEAKGFDFWNSAKIYLSWAWRNSSYISKVSPRFGDMYRSVALEESILLVPNGCGSVTKPECDAETLSMNSLRDLAKPHSKDSSHSDPIPHNPEDDLVQRGARGVNDDFLGTKGFDSASEWLSSFRKNYVQARGSMKNRLQSSIQFLNILSDMMPPTQVAEFVKPLAYSFTMDSGQRDELYYLCTELRLAGDKRIDFMKSEIDRLSELQVMSKAFEGSQRTPRDVVSYFDGVSKNVMPFCEALEKNGTWNAKGYTPNRNGFQDWAKQILSIPTVENIPTEMAPLFYGPALLVWDSSLGNAVGNVICASGIDCARKAIRAMVDLHAVAKYAEAFLPVSSTVNSPDVFNPYSELAACKIYDPWFVTKRNNRRLVADLASTAIFGWNFLPLYVDVDWSAPKVTSFNQLVKDGVIKFDPNIQKSKMEMSLLADFGPLLGAPCAVSISPNSAKAFNFYAFKGITVNYCKISEKEEVVGTGPNDLRTLDPKKHSYCGGCALNFVGVASSVAAAGGNTLTFNPIKLGIYLFRAIHRFVIGKKDKVNIPQSFEVNLDNASQVLKENGLIPTRCLDALGKGYKCVDNLCEAKATQYFERYTHGKVKSINMDDETKGAADRRLAKITSSVCDGEIWMRFTCEDNGKVFKTRRLNGGLYGASKDCRNFLGHNIWGF